MQEYRTVNYGQCINDIFCVSLFLLDKYGIIHSVARPLTEAGIELLYLSTFSTANILVADHRLSEAERILSGGGSTTPSS